MKDDTDETYLYPERVDTSMETTPVVGLEYTRGPDEPNGHGCYEFGTMWTLHRTLNDTERRAAGMPLLGQKDYEAAD